MRSHRPEAYMPLSLLLFGMGLRGGEPPSTQADPARAAHRPRIGLACLSGTKTGYLQS